jgi:YesN/AraC family two-component response regulator
MMSCIEFGKTEQLIKLLKNEKTIDANMGITANDPLRAFKNVFVTSVALASRAAVSGGMDYENAMNMSDAYLQTMEAMDDYEDLFGLWRRMLMDYTERMRKCRRLNPTSKLVHVVFNYVSEHVYKKITTQDIAKALSFSRTYLCSRFKRDTGKNLSQYINEVKIDEAKYLLASTNKTIVEISDLLGFCAQNYFQTVFKKVTGMTPKIYRENSQTRE